MNEMIVVEKEVESVVEQARSFVINSNEDFLAVDAHCAGLLKLKKRIEEDFKASKTAAWEAHKAIVAQEKSHLDGVDDARRIDKAKMLVWSTAQEKLRQQEEATLQAQAQQAAEQAALDAAVEAEQSGDKKQADAILAAPVVYNPVILQKSTPKTSTSIRMVRKFRIIDASKLPLDYMIPDEVKIGKVIRALGASANIPGVIFYEEAA